MAFLLCHDCYSWVEPAEGRCPECQQAVDPSASDPPPATLQSVMGTLVGPLGMVRVRRRMLPEHGTLYLTTTGLCFVPHQAVYVTQEVEVPAGSSALWSLAAVVWSPLSLILPLIRTKRVQQQRVQILEPRTLGDGDSDRLPLLLMQDPGAFFIPQRIIRRIRRRRGRWIIERMHGSPVKLSPETDRRALHTRMTDLLATPAWQGVA